MERETQYCGIWVCSIAFFCLYTAYLNVQTRITTIFKDLNFDNLGPQVIAIRYVSYTLSSMIAPQIVKCLNYRWSFVVSSSMYTLFVIVSLIPAAKDKFEEDGGIFSDISIYILICLSAFLLGMFSQVFWVTQGSYFT